MMKVLQFNAVCDQSLCIMQCGGRTRNWRKINRCQAIVRYLVVVCIWMNWNLIRSVYSSYVTTCGCHSHYVDISLVIIILFSSWVGQQFHRANFLVFTVKYFLYIDISGRQFVAHVFIRKIFKRTENDKTTIRKLTWYLLSIFFSLYTCLHFHS